MLECLILSIISDKLSTSHHQFGFKSKHATDNCVFILKEVVDLYKCSLSPVYLCFMDAKKAFDRVNHFSLLHRLLNRKVPLYIVKLLYKWFSTQRYFVRWNNCVSAPFNVLNAVRQGGILSPFLFNVFMDNLSIALKDSNAGCFFDNVCFNHLFRGHL